VGISHGKSTEIHVFWTLQCDTDRNINMMTMAICITSQSSNHPSVGFEGVTFFSLIKQPDACWLFFLSIFAPSDPHESTESFGTVLGRRITVKSPTCCYYAVYAPDPVATIPIDNEGSVQAAV
jgi:hypothetical protein